MKLTFTLPDGSSAQASIRRVLNGGFSGRTQEKVQAHIDELARLGIAPPAVTPIMIPVSPYLAQQADEVWVSHDRTSGEVEWGLVVADDGELLITLACDHTDRALEVHGIAWSKNALPDVLSKSAWRLSDVERHIDKLQLRAWVTHEGQETEIQSATFAELLAPAFWVDLLRSRSLLEPGTVLISGTVNMHEGVDQFAAAWRAELWDPVLQRSMSLAYEVKRLPQPIF